MAGLGVLLETTAQQQPQPQRAVAAARTPPPAQTISKTSLLDSAGTTENVKGSSSSPSFISCSSSSPAPMALPVAAAGMARCSFLQRCFLCHKELADGKDIYIYRGDRAFCSEECRCRHILLDESDGGATVCARDAAAGRSRRRRFRVLR